jgi:hypothetical protein
VVGIFTQEPQERYVIHVVPTGFVLIALAIQQVGWKIREIRSSPTAPGWQRRVLIGVTLLLVSILVINQISSAFGLQRNKVLDPDYVAAAQFVHDRMEPGDPVYTSMTPAPYLVLGSDEGLNFISGSPYSSRTNRYVRVNAVGESVDYWIGVPSVYLMNDLCNMIIQNPNAWIITDAVRLLNPSFLGGEWALMITGMTYIRHSEESGIMILRPIPAPGRSSEAVSICNQAAKLSAQGIDERSWYRPPLSFIP